MYLFSVFYWNTWFFCCSCQRQAFWNGEQCKWNSGYWWLLSAVLCHYLCYHGFYHQIITLVHWLPHVIIVVAVKPVFGGGRPQFLLSERTNEKIIAFVLLCSIKLNNNGSMEKGWGHKVHAGNRNSKIMLLLKCTSFATCSCVPVQIAVGF